ncbi:facilitated trehalose transporter Tret1-like [Belonocnema kinseyi]|uniref:facilitated trehalose transporter Tret1-like n=1 Tax=Belonocnema kinseyi TaxID=2817044 RepID=UPI00143DA4D9|nr:facilitated trehalose transporter Tret1-like [Belonocnema kinseyi]
MLSWSSPSLEYLRSNQSEIVMTVEQGAWITSSPNIGAAIGYMIVPLLMDRVGRKHTLLISAVPQIISWLMIILAHNVVTLCLARIICGLGYSDLGIFLVATMGAYCSYETMNLILLSIPIIYLVSFIFMPESPYFYTMKGRDVECLKSLMRLRGVKNSEEVKSEIELIKVSAVEDQESKVYKLRDLFSGGNRKGLMIVVFLHAVSMFSGSLAMVAYAHQIFGYSGFFLTASHCYMILGAVKILSGLVATQLIERLGRRMLYITSGICSTLALIIVGIFFLMKLQFKMDVTSISFLPLVGLIIFEIAASVGIGPLPFVLGGELFSVRLKNIAIAVIFITAALAAFLVELIFPIMNKAVGIQVSFLIFAFCCLSGTSFLFYIMPETKGKSLSEIQMILNSKQKIVWRSERL